MVFAEKRSGQRGGPQGSGLQRRNSGRRRSHLRVGPEKSSLPQLCQRTLQREAREGSLRLSPDVSRYHVALVPTGKTVTSEWQKVTSDGRAPYHITKIILASEYWQENTIASLRLLATHRRTNLQ